ncbi:hypothetical protein OROMI_006728 [Orobanche minor]
MPSLEETSGDAPSEGEGDISNLERSYSVSATPIKRIHKDHPLEAVIGEVNSLVHTRGKLKRVEEHEAGFFVHTLREKNSHSDLQNCLFACFLSNPA